MSSYQSWGWMLRDHVRVVVLRYDLPVVRWRSSHWWVQNILSLLLSLMIQNSLIDTKLIYFLFHSKENFQKLTFKSMLTGWRSHSESLSQSDFTTNQRLTLIIRRLDIGLYAVITLIIRKSQIFERSKGFFVSVLFCFMNEEVKKEVKRFIRQTFLKVSTLFNQSRN